MDIPIVLPCLHGVLRELSGVILVSKLIKVKQVQKLSGQPTAPFLTHTSHSQSSTISSPGYRAATLALHAEQVHETTKAFST